MYEPLMYGACYGSLDWNGEISLFFDTHRGTGMCTWIIKNWMYTFGIVPTHMGLVLKWSIFMAFWSPQGYGPVYQCVMTFHKLEVLSCSLRILDFLVYKPPTLWIFWKSPPPNVVFTVSHGIVFDAHCGTGLCVWRMTYNRSHGVEFWIMAQG